MYNYITSGHMDLQSIYVLYAQYVYIYVQYIYIYTIIIIMFLKG